MYDVIVIGAGPAGTTAAKILAENGCRVLLAEKFKMPRYKSCSGQLIKKSLDLVERYFGEPIPASVTCSPAKNYGMAFTDDTGRTFLFEQPCLNVWRSSFDAWLAKKAEAAGAVLREEQTAISCVFEDYSDTVKILFRRADRSTCTEYARYIIDCEGVAGTLKRQITGIKPDYITTFQTFNQGTISLDPHYFYAYLQPELSEYDAWFNVKDDQLVLGVSIKNKEKENYYYNRFLHYMKNYGLKIDRQIKMDRWLMPYIKPGCAIDYGVGRVLFAGEIAGFLNPMGEGISGAMESAFCAANAILQHENDPEAVLTSYQENASALSLYMKRQWSLVGGMAGAFAKMR